MQAFSRRPNPVFSEEYRVLRNAWIEARVEAGFTQTRLAAGLGKSKSHIAMIERGQRRIDSLELYRMAKCLGCDPVELFSRVSRGLDEIG